MNPDLIYTRLLPTGDRLLTPPLGGDGARIVLEGVFTFRYSGMRFDARYRSGPEGEVGLRHDYLEWSPRAPLLERADRARHRYEFQVPAEWMLQGQSVGVRVDVDRFVDEFLIPPSEVRAALTGVLTVRMLPLGATGWPPAAAAGLPVVALAGGLGWVLRRRIALQGLPVELQHRLGRISRKEQAVRSAFGCRGNLRLQESLRALHQGAWALARQFRALERAQSRLDALSLRADAGRLEQALPGLIDAGARAAGQAALAEKRKALALLQEMEGAQSRAAMRLAAIEAALDTTCLTLHQLPAEPPARFEERLLGDLEAEVTAVAEVAWEIEALRDRRPVTSPSTAWK